MSNDLTPILIGAGQYLQGDIEPAEALSPVGMMAACARRAAEDAGVGHGVLSRLDSIAVVNILSWSYGNAPGLLAEQLGANPREQLYSGVGGNTPQLLVNATAAKIARGELRLVLLAGAEAVNTVRRAQRARVPLPWSADGTGRPTQMGDGRLGTNLIEMNHGLQLPAQVYPLFENALRAHRGLSLAAHRERLGQLCAALSSVAAGNPYAWFREARSAGEIATVTPQNRIIGFPYTKYMNAIIDVDQAAAVLMTSVGTARELGVHPSRWVYLWGTADAHDHWFPTERVNYYSSPAIRIAGRRALTMAGVGIDEIDFFDLYSCFPSAVQISRDMLGIAEDDRRALTVTGGLPYHGGPGNNYSMHAIATMMGKLRAAPGSKGLVTALGWYLTKHSIGVYSASPKPGAGRPEEGPTCQEEVARVAGPEFVAAPQGRGTIETYTVLHDRDGRPTTGIVIGRQADGRRFIANTASDQAVLERLMESEAIGRPGVVTAGEPTNRFDPT